MWGAEPALSLLQEMLCPSSCTRSARGPRKCGSCANPTSFSRERACGRRSGSPSGRPSTTERPGWCSSWTRKAASRPLPRREGSWKRGAITTSRSFLWRSVSRSRASRRGSWPTPRRSGGHSAWPETLTCPQSRRNARRHVRMKKGIQRGVSVRWNTSAEIAGRGGRKGGGQAGRQRWGSRASRSSSLAPGSIAGRRVSTSRR